MPVVDVSEHYSGSRRSFLAGWAVTEWDGYVESSRFVPANKGEPDVAVDEAARDEWLAWTADREAAKRWANDVWLAARSVQFPVEVGDERVTTLTMPVGHPVYRDGRLIGRLMHAEKTELVGRCTGVGPDGISVWVLQPGRFMTWPALTTSDISKSRWADDTLARKRKEDVAKMVPGDELWNLVFAWPEAEWEARWGMFVDGIREDRWGWGDGWVRVGDRLAGCDWKPSPMGPAYDYIRRMDEALIVSLGGIPPAVLAGSGGGYSSAYIAAKQFRRR